MPLSHLNSSSDSDFSNLAHGGSSKSRHLSDSSSESKNTTNCYDNMRQLLTAALPDADLEAVSASSTHPDQYKRGSDDPPYLVREKASRELKIEQETRILRHRRERLKEQLSRREDSYRSLKSELDSMSSAHRAKVELMMEKRRIANCELDEKRATIRSLAIEVNAMLGELKELESADGDVGL